MRDKGQELLALVMSWQLRVTHRTALNNLKKESGTVDPSWAKLADDLQRGLVEKVHARRLAAREKA